MQGKTRAIATSSATGPADWGTLEVSLCCTGGNACSSAGWSTHTRCEHLKAHPVPRRHAVRCDKPQHGRGTGCRFTLTRRSRWREGAGSSSTSPVASRSGRPHRSARWRLPPSIVGSRGGSRRRMRSALRSAGSRIARASCITSPRAPAISSSSRSSRPDHASTSGRGEGALAFHQARLTVCAQAVRA